MTRWICFSFKKVDRRSAIIHVFTKTPPTQGSRKVVRFMQNEPQFILYRAQRTNVNILYWTISNHLHNLWSLNFATTKLFDKRLNMLSRVVFTYLHGYPDFNTFYLNCTWKNCRLLPFLDFFLYPTVGLQPKVLRPTDQYLPTSWEIA